MWSAEKTNNCRYFHYAYCTIALHNTHTHTHMLVYTKLQIIFYTMLLYKRINVFTYHIVVLIRYTLHSKKETHRDAIENENERQTCFSFNRKKRKMWAMLKRLDLTDCYTQSKMVTLCLKRWKCTIFLCDGGHQPVKYCTCTDTDTDTDMEYRAHYQIKAERRAYRKNNNNKKAAVTQRWYGGRSWINDK